MPTIVKIAVKDFNPDRLREELATAGLEALIVSRGWAGFTFVDQRRYAPNAGPVIGRHGVSNGAHFEEIVQPGELHLTLSRDLTAQENTDLDGVLSAHNAATVSAEQGRQDQDEANLEALIATERQAYLANLQNWDAMNNTQRQAATKEMFQIIGRLLRHVLRRERTAAI